MSKGRTPPPARPPASATERVRLEYALGMRMGQLLAPSETAAMLAYIDKVDRVGWKAAKVMESPEIRRLKRIVDADPVCQALMTQLVPILQGADHAE